MKYLPIHTIFFTSTFLLLGLIGCDDFIDLEPETSLSSASAFDNIEGIEAGLNGAYSVMQSDWVERQYVFSECLAGNVSEVNAINNTNYQDALRHQSWIDLFNTANYLWAMCYRVIDLSNQVIEAIPAIPEPNQQITNDKNRLLGEALFLRGMNLFVLNRFWGQPQNGLSVPILTKPYQPTDLPARATIEEVKNQVVSDLREAERLMAGVSSNSSRATVWAVKGMLARVYFEYQEYTNAAALADDIINNGLVEGRRLSLLEGDMTPPFSPSLTSENIFTFLGNSRDRANIRLFEMFSLESSAVELSISESYWDIIGEENDDLRIQQLHEDFGVAFACYKYDDREMNIPFMRLPEMYLIRAESRVNQGDLEGGLTDLNTLRSRAGLNPTTYTDQADLLNQIFRERSLELSMEGDNLHNLKRLERPAGGYPAAEAAYKLVFFIPEREVQLNPNLVQNDPW
ncbi:MAG: RagB/SusD family nutrient uptake outer membrane protein [Bacteroidota bacterium]